MEFVCFVWISEQAANFALYEGHLESKERFAIKNIY
jgi:hypothetical protein